MTDDPVTKAATNEKLKRLALTTTASLLQRRMDPRLLAADAAKLILARSIRRVTQVKTTPKQRKRALIGGAVAAATAIGLRVLYRTSREKSLAAPSPKQESDVKTLP
jgi:hypothetical protein